MSEINSAVPVHVGIIMDGNGRWAKQRNLPRTSGHKEGLDVAKAIVKAAAEIGIKYVKSPGRSWIFNEFNPRTP